VLGGFFALMAAATFAWTNAAARRGVVVGSPMQAVMLSIPIGVPVFLVALLLAGHPQFFPELPLQSVLLFAAVGITHFCCGRYCNYRAIKAIGTNLAGPVMQFNLVVSLVLAIFFLGETLTPLRILGILLIVCAPMLVPRPPKPAAPPAGNGDGSAEGDDAPSAAPSDSIFSPRMAEGYIFAFLAAVFYGLSPPLVRYAVGDQGLTGSLAGGLVAAAAAFGVALIALLSPNLRRSLRTVQPDTAKWFVTSGVIVYISQIFAYMAVALAPVTVTAPIIGLNHVFRIHFARWINPNHEVFGAQVIAATAISFLGVVVLTASVENLPLPDAWMSVLRWHWP
jgi:drug/metabolite transporter (DMT)-like permease